MTPTTLSAALGAAAEYKLHLSSLRALLRLLASDITLGSLATHLGVSSASVTQIADSMEKLGYAARSQGTDRRTIWLTITPSGRAAIIDIIAARPSTVPV